MSNSDYSKVEPEDEFKNRDSKGLKVEESETTEGAEMQKYAVMLLVFVPIVQTLLAVGVYFLGAKVFKQESFYEKKFKLMYEWQVGYVYLSVYMLVLMRAVLIMNANGARGPARVDRPDQHVYKIMDKDGSSRDAPYVMMVNTGPQGRFNRAQRGVFNTDEALPVVLANTVLASFVFGPMVCVLLLIVMYGRITFALKYKESTTARGAGFLPAMIGENIIGGLVVVCALKGICYPSIPF